MPHILIAVPCFDQVMADFAFALGRLLLRRSFSGEVIDCRGSDIVVARNSAAKRAVGGATDGTQYTHLLFLDSDMSFPADTLERLLGHGKPIVGASYIRRCEPYNLLGAWEGSVPASGCVEALELPGGCLLINVAVLRKMGWPWFRIDYGQNYGERTGEDVWFCRRAREVGFKVWADMDLTREVAHVGVKRYTVQDGIDFVRRQNASKSA